MSLFEIFPLPVTVAILVVVGAHLGAIINLAVCQLGYHSKPLSPWLASPQPLPRRGWLDRIPVWGWLRLRRETGHFGRLFWLRPITIEVLCAVGLVALYLWYAAGGLYGGNENIAKPTAIELAHQNSLWFVFHATLFVLLLIATFIDLDERTIPDSVTLPGTLLALLTVTLYPQVRLPVREPNQLLFNVMPLHFGSPHELPNWHQSLDGLTWGMAIILIWSFALLPTLLYFRRGWYNGLKYLLATKWPRRRRTTSPHRIRERGIGLFHLLIVGFALCCVGLIAIGWNVGGRSWDALFGALLGMACGGGLTWAVRIIGTRALGMEAMGFGDVTLMVMIGAFLGWQPALLVFALAPFAAIVIAVAQLLISGRPDIAFGPYLCLAACVVTVVWNPIWNDWAGPSVFVLGSLLLYVGAGALVLMGILLFAWAQVKQRGAPEE